MQSNKLKSIYNFLVLLAIFVLLNIVGNYLFTTFDLTDDKRFSITEPTKELLQNLDEEVLDQNISRRGITSWSKASTKVYYRATGWLQKSIF